MTRAILRLAVVFCLPLGVFAADLLPGEQPALGDARITQDQIVNAELELDQIRLAGLRMFTTLFNRLDGYGDGLLNPADTISPGGRPTLQGNGTFLRLNGLDGQGCIECHAIVSAATVPPTMGIGGVGSSVTNAIIQPTVIDVPDADADGTAEFNGRFANPPFVFGAGAVELLGLEMTEDLQALAAAAVANPGSPVELTTHGVQFGSIVADLSGELDTSQVTGVNSDLVVRPFGRKGEFATIRDFDLGALQFHFGMQPTEIVGDGVDDDGDGVFDEVLVGELSSLSVLLATMDRPVARTPNSQIADGFQHFVQTGCAACHVPTLETREKFLPLRFPEVPTAPRTNVFLEIDLTEEPMEFEENGAGGIVVPLFADLKRHDMGPGLAESFGTASAQTNSEFTTARLWGIADTAPYLHDGRATTLSDAILLHGGEAQAARDAFENLDGNARTKLLTFLRSLRTPESPLESLLVLMNDDDDEGSDDGGHGEREFLERAASSGSDGANLGGIRPSLGRR